MPLPGRGQRILFTSDAGHGLDIYTYDLRSKELKQLTSDAPGHGAPYWSPDERLIIYTVCQGEQEQQHLLHECRRVAAEEGAVLKVERGAPRPSAFSQ